MLPRSAEVLNSYHDTGQFLKSQEEQNTEPGTDCYPAQT